MTPMSPETRAILQRKLRALLDDVNTIGALAVMCGRNGDQDAEEIGDILRTAGGAAEDALKVAGRQ